MNILVVTPQYPPKTGGIASFVENIISNWPQSDKFVILTTPNNDTDFKDKSTKIYRKKFNRFSLIFSLWSLVKKHEIEMIHLHSPYIMSSFSLMLLKRIIKVPYRLFLHSIDFNYIKKNKLQRLKIAAFLNSAQKIVVNSTYLKDQFERIFVKQAREPIVVYPCPSDHFFNEHNEEELTALRAKLALVGKKVVITVARLDEGKGYPRLISILPKVLAKYPNLVWIIVGDGPKKQNFMEMIAQNNLQNIIRYIGNVPHLELTKYYQLASLFVLLTHPDPQAEEDWATVFLEAAASKLPVVGGRVGGIDEQIIDGKTGKIVDISNEEEVVNAINSLLEDKNTAQAFGTAGNEWMKNLYKWSDQINKIIA